MGGVGWGCGGGGAVITELFDSNYTPHSRMQSGRTGIGVADKQRHT